MVFSRAGWSKYFALALLTPKGQSTLLIGPGIDGSFAGIKSEMKTLAFITFDANKQFSDFGLKRTVEVEVSGTLFLTDRRLKLVEILPGLKSAIK